MSVQNSQSRRLNASIFWNLAGNLLPLVVALFSIPALIKALGNERFGLLTIAWMLVGYFSLFDFGLGKALTKITSEKIAEGKSSDIPNLASHALFAMICLGLCAGIVLAILSPWLTESALKISSHYQNDACYTFLILALSVPAVVVCTALIGLLEAHQRFFTINMVRIPLGISNFAGPFLALQLLDTLSLAVFTIFIFRLIALVFYWRAVNGLFGKIILPKCNLNEIVPLLKFGGWASVSNLISPVMVYFDRFVIGAVLSIAVVAYYTTPYEIISRVSIISISMLGVFFPAMAAAFAANRGDIEGIYKHAFLLILYSIFPVLAIAFAFAPQILNVWLGAEFSAHSANVLRVLAIGAFFNSLARVPFGLIQAAGRADLTAKINLMEVLPYLSLLYVLLPTFGIEGAAYAWTGRLCIDFFVMSWVALRLTPELSDFYKKKIVLISGVFVCFAALVWVANGMFKVMFLLPLVSYSLYYIWANFLNKLKKG